MLITVSVVAAVTALVVSEVALPVADVGGRQKAQNAGSAKRLNNDPQPLAHDKTATTLSNTATHAPATSLIVPADGGSPRKATVSRTVPRPKGRAPIVEPIQPAQSMNRFYFRTGKQCPDACDELHVQSLSGRPELRTGRCVAPGDPIFTGLIPGSEGANCTHVWVAPTSGSEPSMLCAVRTHEFSCSVEVE